MSESLNVSSQPNLRYNIPLFFLHSDCFFISKKDMQTVYLTVEKAHRICTRREGGDEDARDVEALQTQIQKEL